MDGAIALCSLCGGKANLISQSQPGYVRGTRYAIYRCTACAAKFCDPKEADSAIYDAIYRQQELVPGYARYRRFATDARSSGMPLDYLAKQEDVYWAVRNALLRFARPGCSVLEVGSGLGYLTFALRSAGFNAFGIDLSQKAVSNATKAFGEFYRCQDVNAFTECGERFDVIVSTEVIEHVEDPVQFLSDLQKCLHERGVIVLTTPNASFYSDRVVWETDPPPVHLWWFSEQSLKALASRLRLAVQFIDFTELNKRRYLPIRKIPEATTTRSCILTERYSVPDNRGRGLRPPFQGLRDLLKPIVGLVQRNHLRYGRIGPTLAAVFHRP